MENVELLVGHGTVVELAYQEDTYCMVVVASIRAADNSRHSTGETNRSSRAKVLPQMEPMAYSPVLGMERQGERDHLPWEPQAPCLVGHGGWMDYGGELRGALPAALLQLHSMLPMRCRNRCDHQEEGRLAARVVYCGALRSAHQL